jgi:hypothetical protein
MCVKLQIEHHYHLTISYPEHNVHDDWAYYVVKRCSICWTYQTSDFNPWKSWIWLAAEWWPVNQNLRCFYYFSTANSLECKHTALRSHRVAGVVVLAARVVEDVVMTVDAADTTHTDLVVKMQRGRVKCCFSTFD